MTEPETPQPTFEPTHTPASKIIDAQIDLRTRIEDRAWQQIFLSMALWTIAPPDLPETEITELGQEVLYGQLGRDLIDLMRGAASEATAYRVSPDMVALALHTSETLDESDIVDINMAPSRSGFVRLEVPIPSLHEGGRVIPANWLLWYTFELPGEPPTVVAWLFHDLIEFGSRFVLDELHATDRLAAEEGYDASRRILGRWHPEWRTAIRHGDSVGPAMYDYAARDFDDQIADLGGGVAAILMTETREYKDINPARFLYGLFMLMAQPVVSVEPEDGDRATRRRAARSDLDGPTRDGAIRLVKLKRERTGAEPTDEPWDDTVEGRRSRVRWITRQHWRWQPYGPRKGVEHEHDFGTARAEDGVMTAHCTCEADPDIVESGKDSGSGRCPATLRRILIDSYVKGPEGAPLKINPKVIDVT